MAQFVLHRGDGYRSPVVHRRHFRGSDAGARKTHRQLVSASGAAPARVANVVHGAVYDGGVVLADGHDEAALGKLARSQVHLAARADRQFVKLAHRDTKARP